MGQRRLKGALRERAVVEAAAELIAEKGLAELRMADVAERADMSVGHVTYYFPSKAHLLVQAISRREEVFQTQVRDALADEVGSWDRLRLLIEHAAAGGPADPDWLLWFEVWVQAAVDETVGRTQRALDGWWREAMTDIVSRGVASGEFRCEDVEEVVDVLSALTDGLSVRLTLSGQPMTRQRLLGQVLRVARLLLDVPG